MKEAIELREAIALTIAEVTEPLPSPVPLWLMDGPSGHSSPYLSFPVLIVWFPIPSLQYIL